MPIKKTKFRMKRVSKKSRLVLLLIEDWRKPPLSLREFKDCFSGKGVNVMCARFLTFDTAKAIAKGGES